MNAEFDDKQIQAFLEQVIRIQVEHFRAEDQPGERERREEIKRVALELLRKRQGKRP